MVIAESEFDLHPIDIRLCHGRSVLLHPSMQRQQEILSASDVEGMGAFNKNNAI